MSKLSQLFVQCKNENRAALIGYLPAGFPTQEGSINILKAMIKGGVDAVEIGFPYSDPVMDGPVIQEAAELARQNGITMAKTLEIVKEISATGTPTLLMTYWNPIERYGIEKFAKDFSTNGMEGVITPDLTLEEALPWLAAAETNSIHPIFVVAPSTGDERLKVVTSNCSGFIYAASSMGVTGTQSNVANTASVLVERIRKISDTPVAVGLGVSNRTQASEVAKFADGVIVGSAFVKAVLQNPQDPTAAVTKVAQELALGVRER
ncbi:MAG: tryptophan synthase subunit alpha [Candidatus Nanopelagicaceae bacterium]